jgi:hypothetical protein
MNEKGQLTASTRLLAGLGAGVSINNFKLKKLKKYVTANNQLK